MHRLIISLLTLLMFTACQENHNQVEFKRIDQLELGNLSKENAKLKGTIVFTNLTDNDLELKDLILDFSIDGKDIGTIVKKSAKKVSAKSEFTVPFQYSYETSTFKEAGHDPAAAYSVQLKGELTLLNTDGKEVKSKVTYTTSYEYKTKEEIRQEKREDRKERRQQRREERKEKRNN